MKKKFIIIIGLVGIFIVGGIAGIMGKDIAHYFTRPKPNAEKFREILTQELQSAAEVMNKQMPMKVDDETRLDKVLAGPGMKMTYFYTLYKHSKETMTPQRKRDFYTILKNKVCTETDSKWALENGTEYKHVYRSNDGEGFFVYNFTQADCINP